MTKADVDGSDVLVFVVGGVGSGELWFIAVFCSKPTPVSGDAAAAAAVRAFAFFFFVILNRSKNVFGKSHAGLIRASRYSQ